MSRATSASGSKPASRMSSRKRAKQTTSENPRITEESLHAAIAEAAYYRAEKRGFEPGHELDDWLAAEMEIAAMKRGRGTSDRPVASRQGSS